MGREVGGFWPKSNNPLEDSEPPFKAILFPGHGQVRYNPGWGVTLEENSSGKFSLHVEYIINVK